MESILPYFIKVNLALAILYMAYLLLFRNDTFFRLRRITLLAIFAFAFIYPFPNLSGWIEKQPVLKETIASYSGWLQASEQIQIQDQEEADIIYASVVTELKNNISETLPAQKGKEMILPLLFGIYLLGVALLFFRCIAEFVSLFRTYRRSERRVLEGIKVNVSSEIEEPYSFFNWIFINPAHHNHQALHEIILHEDAHAQQIHSLDVVLAEIVVILCWFNPFSWLLKQEISINHEYIADRQVMRAGFDKKSYQYHLIGLEHHKPVAAANLYNYFSVLPLKKRITMLNKKRTNRARTIKYLALIPMAAGLLILNNLDAMARTFNGLVDNTLNTEEAIEIAPVEMDIPMIQQKDSVYAVAEKSPQFPGGEQALLKFLTTNIKYPEIAIENKKEGRVVISFIIEKDGSISNPKVARSVDPSLDKEAMRVIMTSPKWTPGEIKGEIVRVKYTMPIMFALPGKATTENKAKGTAPVESQKSDDDVKTVVDKSPQFPGGEEALLKFIEDNKKYPPSAIADKKEGLVVLSFVIDTDGNITNEKVVRSADPALDKEALRLMKSMPKWTPGEDKGEVVKVRYAMPIHFKIPK